VLLPGSVRAQTHEDRHVTALASDALLRASPVVLVDPVEQRRARAITDLQQGMFAGWSLAPIVAFFWLWKSGNAARLRDWLRRRSRAPAVVRAAFGATLGLLAMVAAFPFAFASYRIAAAVGLTRQPIPSWVLGEVARAVGTTPVSVDVATEASRSGISPARTSGLGPFTRIVLDRDALARTTTAERTYILARQYAHVLRHDVLWLALSGATLFVLAAALAVLISDRIGFRRDDDPLARLALVGTFLGLTVLLLLPAYNRIERGAEARADRIALAATRDPAAAVRLFVRTANDNLVPLCGRRTTRWYFDSRPPLGVRIAAVTGRADPCPR
jgi:Zn-dependent protease with chaperone function